MACFSLSYFGVFVSVRATDLRMLHRLNVLILMFGGHLLVYDMCLSLKEKIRGCLWGLFFDLLSLDGLSMIRR